MTASSVGGVPAKGDSVTGFLTETHSLANDVGPGWALVLVVAICLFFPGWGVFIQLARLFKEDRADARKQKLESERLLTRYRQRKKAVPAPPKPKNPPGGKPPATREDGV